jgi:molybdopterin converting factor small subunit
MKIRVEFYSQLYDLTGVRRLDLDLDLPPKSTVADLLEEVYAKLPALRSRDKSILVGVGVEFVARSYELKPGDEISVMPPVQGG